MLKILYLILGMGVILLYLASSWLGWEFANSGRSSYFRAPYVFGGYRGGK